MGKKVGYEWEKVKNQLIIVLYNVYYVLIYTIMKPTSLLIFNIKVKVIIVA